MKIEAIENILTKKVTCEATSSELAILEQWRSESEENQSLYDEYSILWNMSANYDSKNFNPDFESALESHLSLISNENKIQPTTQEEAKVRSINSKKTVHLFAIKNIRSIAALFILGIAAIFLLGNDTTTIIAENGVLYTSLEDGTKIWIDEGSSIEYKSGFGVDHRNVELKGKVFFDVNRNENLPFNIKESDINVTVLGTSFTIDGNLDVVSVIDGTVSVAHQDENIILIENEEARLIDNKFNTELSDLNTALWRNSLLSFDDSPISQVIADINMYHDDILELDDMAQSANCTFTSGGLSTESLDNIIEILRKSFDLKVTESSNGKIKLLLSDCS